MKVTMYVTDFYYVKTGSDKITGIVCEWQITIDKWNALYKKTSYTWCS